MSRSKKLIEKIRARPVEADYRDIERLLQDFGWIWSRDTGSHAIFTKRGAPSITIPKKHGRKVKRVYLGLICEMLGLDDIDVSELDD